MLRSLLRASAALAFALLIAPAVPSAAPPPGLAYDEIVRVVVNATPPPPGNFQADVAAINTPQTAASATPAPKKRGFNIGNIGNIAGSIANGGLTGNVAGNVATSVASQAISAAMSNMFQQSLGAQFNGLAAAAQNFLQPHLTRYAYWNGWERVEDVAAQTATIRKCDAGQVIHLDLAKKTYTMYDPNTEPTDAPAAAPAQPPHRGRATPPDPQQPGTAAIDLSSTTKSLGPLRIENQATAGYDSTTALTISKSTGSCHDANTSMENVQYVSALNQPSVTRCPIRARPIPQSADEMVTAPTGGCRPTFTAHRSGPTPPSNKLALYSLVKISAGATAAPPPNAGPGAGQMGFLTERGNLKTLGPTDAGLFSVPQGFTKTP